MAGVPGATKAKPFVSPLYSGGTSHQDSKDNMGMPAGPKGGQSSPDPLGYGVHKKGKK